MSPKDLREPLPTEGSRRMAFQSSTMVNRPIEVLFDCVANVTFMQRLITASTPEVRQLTEGAMGVGTKFRQSAGASGRPLEATIEVIEYQRPTVFAFEATRGVDVTRMKWIFKSTSDGTMVHMKVRTRRHTWLGRVVRVMAFLVAPHAQTVSPEDAQGLRRLLEEQC